MRYQVRMHPEYDILVSSIGEVFIPQNRANKEHWTMGSNSGKKQYLTVSINNRPIAVHRLVAQTFIPNPHNYHSVDHKNRVRTCNTVDNLRWATQKMQTDNTIRVINSVKKYGVRYCDDSTAYARARRMYKRSVA